MKPGSHVTFTKHHSQFIVGVIDIVRSTEITASLSANQIDDFYTIFLEEISLALKTHGAHIIKNMGDGVLFYFPETNTNEATAKTAIACGENLLTARKMINEKMRAKGLPEISYRVSESYGPVSAMLDADLHVADLFGATVNTCAKINKLARPDSLVIGEALRTLLDDTFQAKKIADYRVSDALSFGVFEVKND